MKTCKEIAEMWSIPYLDLFSGSNMRPWDSAFNQSYYNNSDKTHPNEDGYKFFKNKIISFLQTI